MSNFGVESLRRTRATRTSSPTAKFGKLPRLAATRCLPRFTCTLFKTSLSWLCTSATFYTFLRTCHQAHPPANPVRSKTPTCTTLCEALCRTRHGKTWNHIFRRTPYSKLTEPPAPTLPNPGCSASSLGSWPSAYVPPHASFIRMYHWTKANSQLKTSCQHQETSPTQPSCDSRNEKQCHSPTPPEPQWS